ncbi:glycosyltransferase family 8 protein [Lactobacillus sp. PV012]|uniref:glycosyltransferase family 8 protein n=1 Tax=Lactobacillus sp. PV012 TaxID=2594494 RepID=UPI002240524B|nr:glycosyltransferase family 8 protein [Lactobacillus sp. PV012]QNQ81670.1 glycosyltransferase family 8 protein [Lactobacillus sp. PV012]
MTTIPVFYTITDNYTPYAGVSIQSLINHANPNRDYTIYVLVQEISEEHKQALKNLATDNVHINIFHIDDELLKPITNTKENYLRGQFFTMAIFYRLFIPELFPQYDKSIYLDADTIVNTDIAELYDTDLGNNMFGSAPDLSIRYMPLLQEYIKQCQGIFPPEKYINNGVILFNLKAFREKKFIDRFLYLLGKYQFDNLDPDQAYMNEICEDYIYHLDGKWDTMPNESIPPIKDPKIVHYNLFFKPWHFEDVQYGNYFWDVAKETPFYETLKQELANFTDADRQKQRDDLEKMAQRVKEIEQTNTWAKVKQQGEKIKL